MLDMTENRLRQLLDYGLLTVEEKTRILREYKQLGTVTEKNTEFFNILKNSIIDLETEEKELKAEKEELFVLHEKLNNEIIELRKKRANDLTEKQLAVFKNEEKVHAKNINITSLEFLRINRKIDEILEKSKVKIDKKALENARQKLS